MVAARGLAGGAACTVGAEGSKTRMKSKVKVRVKPNKVRPNLKVRTIAGRIVVGMGHLLSDAGSSIF
jgi:hypothetical protein